MRDINSRGALGLGEEGRAAFGPGGAQLVLFCPLSGDDWAHFQVEKSAQEGKGPAQGVSAGPSCQGATSPASDILLPSHHLSPASTPTCSDSLAACSVPRHCGCHPCTSLLGDCDRTRLPRCSPPNPGLQLGPQRGGPSGHCGLGHLPGRHAGLDCHLSAGWVGPCTYPHPRKSFLRSNLIPAHCNWRPLGAGTECGWKEAEEERKVKGCNWKGRRSEDKVPGMGRQRESREQNIKAGKEKGEVGGLREAPPHLFPNPALAPPAFPSGRVHLPSGLAFLSRVPPLT